MSDAQPAVCPLPDLIRIRVGGADRAAFLHNFCTNDVTGLAAGAWCEAFFTNVKARIVAHGLILADDEHHEIWMLPGNEQQLLDHLNRYIITEDVDLQSITADSNTIAVIGPLPGLTAADSSTSGRFGKAGSGTTSVRHLTLTWAEQPVHLLTGSDQNDALLTAVTQDSEAAATVSACSAADFDRLRIQARFPLIGRDLNDHHLAPEAARNPTAISYQKGCYLGQEPIARLDALGQVRRVLAAVELQEETAESDQAADLTSVSLSPEPAVGLAVVSADSIHTGQTVVRLPDGPTCSATIIQPASLTGDES